MTDRNKLEKRLHGIFVFLGSTILWNVAQQNLISFGVYFPEFLESVHHDGRVISCILAINQLMSIFAGLVGSEILRRYGSTVTGMLSTFLMFSGFCVSIMYKHIILLIIGYGILSGCAVAFSVQTTQYAIQTVFPKKRSMMSGMAGFLATFSTLLVPMLVRWLIDTYGWRGSMLIQAGMFLQAAPFVMMMPVFRPKSSQIKTNATATQQIKTNTTRNRRNDNKRGITSFIINVFDFSLLKDYRVLLFYLTAFIIQVMVTVLFGLTVARAMWMGQDKYNAVVIVTVLCIGNSCGRLVSGLIGDCFSRLVQTTVHLFLTGLFINVAAFIHDLVPSCIAAGLMGLEIGGSIVMFVTSLVNVTGEENLAKALALFLASVGLGGCCGPPIAEFIATMSGSYDISFHVIGCLAILGSFFLMIVTVSINRQKRKHKETTNVMDLEISIPVSENGHLRQDETEENLVTKT